MMKDLRAKVTVESIESAHSVVIICDNIISSAPDMDTVSNEMVKEAFYALHKVRDGFAGAKEGDVLEFKGPEVAALKSVMMIADAEKNGTNPLDDIRKELFTAEGNVDFLNAPPTWKDDVTKTIMAIIDSGKDIPSDFLAGLHNILADVQASPETLLVLRSESAREAFFALTMAIKSSTATMAHSAGHNTTVH